MALVVTYLDRSDARYAESLCQERPAMTEKTSLQRRRQWICIVTAVTVWFDLNLETNLGPSQKKPNRKNITN